MRLHTMSILSLLSAVAFAQPPQAELPYASPNAASAPAASLPAGEAPIAAPAEAAPPVEAIAEQRVETPAAPAAPAAVAMAAPPASATAVDDGSIGAGTRSWLDLQVSGAASVNEPRPMPGEVATRVYGRYLKSFTYPIPQMFPRQSFVGSTGGGSSGSGTGTSAGTGTGDATGGSSTY